jgi:hypothetical protein
MCSSLFWPQTGMKCMFIGIIFEYDQDDPGDQCGPWAFLKIIFVLFVFVLFVCLFGFF